MKHSNEAMTVSPEVIDKFRNWCIARGRSMHTAKAYTSDLNQFLLAVGETEIPVTQFQDLAMVWLNNTRRSTSPKTTGRRLTSLRAFGKWLGLDNFLADYIAPTPAKSMPHPLPEGMEGVFRMLAVAKTPEDRAMVALCGLVGCRIGEALSIRPMDIDLAEMLVTVRGKGDKTRIVPLSKRAWDNICNRFVEVAEEPDKPLVRTQDRTARSRITSMGKRAHLKRDVASHDLRATFATHLASSGHDIRTVQELLGHASVLTTQLYTGVDIANMRKAVDL